MGDELLDKLRAEVAAGRVVFVVGTGVSIEATGGNSVAGWTGLLRPCVGRSASVLGIVVDLVRRRFSRDHSSIDA